MPAIYLCGAMEGLSAAQAQLWRAEATKFYIHKKVSTLDPCRRTKFHDQQPTTNLSNRLVALDTLDISKADIVLCNLKDRGEGKAWGSVMELVIASQYNVPVITILEEGFYHPFISFYSTEIHHTLAEGLEASLEYLR